MSPPMKKTQSFRVDPELVKRLEILAKGSRIKKGTLIEMCIEKHLPDLEAKYADEVANLIEKELLAQKKHRSTFPSHHPQGSSLNEIPPKKKAS
jgi:predicted DNA-binding protein